ncbi:hypothetical protein HNQ92_003036 [Rhabdobacter roseus]|uniref:Uncharacterized protein n=1 Tax=Rhabdobacter roseus TaxID=1655419 RepID=A0A840TXG2_9BACT|nr:hypothetical protein [Rhabdobacter roseus]
MYLLSTFAHMKVLSYFINADYEITWVTRNGISAIGTQCL